MVSHNTTDIHHNLAENLDWRFAEWSNTAVAQPSSAVSPWMRCIPWMRSNCWTASSSS
jgi:hypothetical protein